MCDFPSWKVRKGKCLFCTDEDLIANNIDFLDGVGHSAIDKVHGPCHSERFEGFPCHPTMAKAIMNGQCDRMMRAYGYKTVKLDKKGRLHCTYAPALVWKNGTERWYLNDQLHREDGPAIEYANGNKYWYLNGQLHREDGPAVVEYANGTKCWYRNGQLHREDGPAIEHADGSKCWYLNGQLHREDGPAIEHADGSKCWYLNGQLHREDGPAVIFGTGGVAYYLNGKVVSENTFNRRKAKS